MVSFFKHLAKVRLIALSFTLCCIALLVLQRAATAVVPVASLYYYAKDTKAGDTTGQAVGDVWWVVGADGAKVSTQ